MMRVFVFVNQVQEIGARQTTGLLIASLLRKGHDVYLADVDGLSLKSGTTRSADAVSTHKSGDSISFKVDAIKLSVAVPVTSGSVAKFASMTVDSSFESFVLDSQDFVMIRTNPGRDEQNASAHELLLEICRVAKINGLTIVNDPGHLEFFASKAAVALLPDAYRPEMLVTNRISDAVSFVNQANTECVVKPNVGSRGINVIRVSPDSDDLQKLLEERFLGQSFVVQRFIESNEVGDKRVVVVGGKLIQFEGHLAGIHRIPAEGEFRANLHKGGKASPLKLSSAEREAATAAASILNDHGIQLAGIDLIGTKVIEFNVFSTGGLFDANRFAGTDFSEIICDELLQ